MVATEAKRKGCTSRLAAREEFTLNLREEVWEAHLACPSKSCKTDLSLLRYSPYRAPEPFLARDYKQSGRILFYTDRVYTPADPGWCHPYVFGNWLFLVSLEFPNIGQVHVIECTDRVTAEELGQQKPPCRGGARKGGTIVGVSRWRSYKHPVCPPYQRVNSRSGCMPFQEARDRWIAAFQAEKQKEVREAEVKRLARHKGFRVQRPYLEDPAQPGYGTYRLVNNTTDNIIGGGESDYCLTLEDIERFLKEQPEP